MIPFGIASWMAVFWLSFRLAWLVHKLLYPAHQLHDYWMCDATPFPFTLMTIGPMIGSIGAGMMLANGLIWLIPPARRAMDAEAGKNPGLKFRGAMRGMLMFSAWTWIIGMAVALLAACFLGELPKSGLR